MISGRICYAVIILLSDADVRRVNRLRWFADVRAIFGASQAAR